MTLIFFLLSVRSPRYSKEEFARRGNELYEFGIRSEVEKNKDDDGKIVAIAQRQPLADRSFEMRYLTIVEFILIVSVVRLHSRLPNKNSTGFITPIESYLWLKHQYLAFTFSK